MRVSVAIFALLCMNAAVSAVPLHLKPLAGASANSQHHSIRSLHATQPAAKLPSDSKELAKRTPYSPTSWYDKPKNLFALVGGLTTVALGVGVLAQKLLLNNACDYVTKQQRHLQHEWDLRHPDGFVPVGGQMRPIDPICQTKLIDLKGPDQWTNY